MIWRGARYGAVAALATIFGLAAPVACFLGAVAFGVAGFGFASWEFVTLAGLCLACFVAAVFIDVRLVIPTVRFCIREARGL